MAQEGRKVFSSAGCTQEPGEGHPHDLCTHPGPFLSLAAQWGAGVWVLRHGWFMAGKPPGAGTAWGVLHTAACQTCCHQSRSG